jgi:serine/threonine protein kinase
MLGQELKGRYKIIAALSAGGFGQTYIAEDTQRPGSPQCVVKHLKPATNDSTFLEIARRLFNTEAQILERVGRHDQIPQLLAYFEENQEFYLVQDFIAGHPLAEEMKPGQPMSEAQVVGVLQDVLGILAFVHSHGVIHRDIKPNNIMRRKLDNKLVLIDFGAVKEIRTQLANPDSQGGIISTITVAIGTGGYIAPEQAMGHPRISSDIYALGMTAIQALTGSLPIHLPEDSQTGHLIWRNRTEVSSDFAAILDKMICKPLVQRYSSAIEVLADLQTLTSSHAPSTIIAGAIAPTLPATSAPQLNPPKLSLSPELQTKLEELLSQVIGPIAHYILKQSLNQVTTPQDLIESLIRNIPVHQQAEFRTSAHRLLTTFKQSANQPVSGGSTPVSTPPNPVSSSELDPAFIKRCEQELSQLIGPFASFICQRTITQNPGISALQLVEALAQQIPHPKEAIEFRRRLLS